MTTTHSGVDSNDHSGFDSNDDAADAILNQWLDAGKLSKDDEGAPSSKGSETDPEDEDDNEVSEELDLSSDEDEDETDQSDAEDDDDETDESEPVEAKDDAVVKLTVDGEDRTVSVKDLKRLYGQEASLTRKSQEVAQARKTAEDEGARYTVAAQTLLTRAQARFEPYAKLDWLVVQQHLQPDEFAALRKEAREAYEDIQFLTSEVDGVFQKTQAERTASVAEEAKKAVEVLKQEIPDWNQTLYDSIREYAIGQKLDEAHVNALLDPYAIKLIYKAMKYDDAVAKAKTKKTAAPKKVLKSKAKAAQIMGKPTIDAEMKKLSQTGSTDAAVDAFMARWAAQADSDA